MSSAGRFRRLSASGASALSLWRLEAGAAELQSLCGRESLPEVDRPVLATLRAGDGAVLDQGVFWLRGAGSPAVAEWHLHGGYGVAAGLRAELLRRGWVEEEPALDPDLRRFQQARGPLNARVAAEAVDGVFDRAWRALDGLGADDRERARKEMEVLLEWARVLEEPPAVVLAGPPNAGKSTLFNDRLREERVTVSPHPGTTRDTVTAGILLGDGDDAFEAWLSDTAGLWSEARGLDEQSVDLARRSVEESWRTIWVFDAAQPPDAAARRALENARPGDLRLLHRTDLGEKWSPEDTLGGKWIRASSRTGESGAWPALEAALIAALGPPPPPGAPVPLGPGRRRLLARAGS